MSEAPDSARMISTARPGAAPSRLGQALVYVFLAIAVIVFVTPFYWLILGAFKSGEDIFRSSSAFLPVGLTVRNFAELFQRLRFARSAFNSVFIACAHTVLALFLCSLGGFAFAKYRAPGRELLFYFVLGTMMIPGVVTFIPLFSLLARMGWVNTYRALIIPGVANAFGIFWMRQYCRSHVPDELLDAGRIDGCSEFGLYWRIVVPTVRPALGALGILTFMGIWNSFLWPYIIARTEDMFTMQLHLFMLQSGETQDYGLVMAGALITTLPLLIVFLLFQRHFVQSILSGATKA